MPRYFLTRAQVEGFRGINNPGNPLDIKFKDDKLNSVFAANGLCKSSLFEALSYAIFGDVRKLAELHAAESASDYYCNRFHPTQAASIALTLRPDDGSEDVVVRVRRSSAGVRSVDSPSGHPDPEGFLAALRSDFVLLDQHTFAKFLEDSPLDRGRSFSSLLGLAKLSEYRQMLETIARTQTLRSDFEIGSLEAQVAGHQASVRAAEATTATAYRDLVGEEPLPSFDPKGIAAAATNALSQVALLKPFFDSVDIVGVNFDEIRATIRESEGGEKREEHASVLREQAELEGLAAAGEEETEQEALRKLFTDRDAALSRTRGRSFHAMLNALRSILVSEEWPNPKTCPACNSTLESSLLERVDAELAAYAQVEQLHEASRTAWSNCSWGARLRRFEQSGALAIPEADRVAGTLDAQFQTGEPEVANIDSAAARLAELEALRKERLAALSTARAELESALPPSLVALAEQVELAQRIQEALSARAAAFGALKEAKQRLATVGRWIAFVEAARETFSNAEVALSTARTTAIETQYRSMYDAITQNAEVVPALHKDDRSEGLLLRLERFYGLQDVSAPTLLQESYRNALAISIFLSTALEYSGPARFVVLDDVTSSFDAGHQFFFMELLRTRIARPLNRDGPQVVVLSHDGLLEKYFDRMAAEGQLHHQRLQGAPPNGFVFTQSQSANRLRQSAEVALQAGQVDKASPLVRQYLEFVLLGVIRGVGIKVPLDFSIRDDRKVVQNCIDAVLEMVDTHEKAGDLILTQQQRGDLRNIVVPSLVGNWVSHYATGSGASFTPHVLLAVLQAVDNFAGCFKYACSCSGTVSMRFYKTLTSKHCGC